MILLIVQSYERSPAQPTIRMSDEANLQLLSKQLANIPTDLPHDEHKLPDVIVVPARGEIPK